MAHLGSIRNDVVGESSVDPRGIIVNGNTGAPLGEVIDAVFDHDTMEVRYVVIESSADASRFMLPAESIFIDPNKENSFRADASQEHVTDLPRYDDKALHSKNDWKSYEESYRKTWHAAPVQHRRGSDRNITPDEVPSSSNKAQSDSGTKASRPPIASADLFPERLTGKFTDPAPGGHKVTLRPRPVARVEEAATGVNMLRPRWEALTQFLQRKRKDIERKCAQCSDRAAQETPEAA